MLSLVLFAALAQSPEPTRVAVVQSSNLGVNPKRVSELTAQIMNALIAERLEPLESRVACKDRNCVTGIGKDLKVNGVIALAFAAVGKDTVIDLECLLVRDDRTLAQVTFTLKPADTRLPPDAAKFAAEVKQALTPAQSDVPRATSLLPPPAEPIRPVVVATRPAEHSRVPGLVVGGFAVAAGATSVALLATAMSQAKSANAEAAPGVSALNRPEAQAGIDRANTYYSVSAAVGGAAGALAIAAVVLLLY